MRTQLWDSAVLKQWSAAIAMPSPRMAQMGLAGPHNIGDGVHPTGAIGVIEGLASPG